MTMKQLTEIAGRIGARLEERGETVAVAESAAGGLISAALLSVPGASAYYLGGGVIYTHAARRGLLGLAGDQVTIEGASEEFALLSARVVRERCGAIWGIGESGAAGPTGSRYGHAAGHVALAVAGPVERSAVIETGSADREANMWAFAGEALKLLEAAIAVAT
jgi:PncC family amidohydrolase